MLSTLHFDWSKCIKIAYLPNKSTWNLKILEPPKRNLLFFHWINKKTSKKTSAWDFGPVFFWGPSTSHGWSPVHGSLRSQGQLAVVQNTVSGGRKKTCASVVEKVPVPVPVPTPSPPQVWDSSSGSTIRTLLHGKINPKDWQVLSLADVGFLLFF